MWRRNKRYPTQLVVSIRGDEVEIYLSNKLKGTSPHVYRFETGRSQAHLVSWWEPAVWGNATERLYQT